MTFQSASVHVLSPAAAPTAQAISLGELNGDATHCGGADAMIVASGTNPLHAIRARLQACVGQVEMTIGELLAARENQVLVLDRMVDQPVDLMLEGKLVARGQLVAVDGVFAVRITDLPLPLRP